MELNISRLSDPARIALALIRLFNGALALLAPALLARNLGVDPNANPSLLYVFRMFGIRTVLIALDLLRDEDSPARVQALRRAPLIHASDTVAALLAGFGGLRRRSAVTIVLISGLNTALAVLAQGGRK